MAGCTSYFKSTGDNGNNIILLELNLSKNEGYYFLENYQTNKLNSPVLIMGSSKESETMKLIATYPFVKNFIQKPINKESAEKIFNKKALVE